MEEGKVLKGRGFDPTHKNDDSGNDKMETDLGPSQTSDQGPVKSREGYILIVTGVHEEAEDEDIFEAFSDFGEVSNIHLNPDRQTGYVKGYALIEYETAEEGEEAIREMNGKTILDKEIQVGWAFARRPDNKKKKSR